MPKVNKRCQTFNVCLFRPHSKPIGKPTDLHTILDHLDDRGRHEPQTPPDSWHSTSLIPCSYTYFLSIFNTALATCVTTGVVFVLCRCLKLQALVASLALAPIPKVEVNPLPTHTVVCSSLHLTALATVITIIGLLLWLFVHCENLTWLRGYHYNRTCTLFIFLYNGHFHVPIKIKRLSGHVHMYRLTNTIIPDGFSAQSLFAGTLFTLTGSACAFI